MTSRDSGEFQESFRRVSREFHESFTRVSREFHESFTRFQGGVVNGRNRARNQVFMCVCVVDNVVANII